MRIREVVNPQDLILEKPKKNVCAYARISSSKDVSHMSFENQVDTYTSQIMRNNDWNYVGVFADESKSGTNTLKRPQFNQMINMAKNGLIDLILTKSISRFARNTIDSLSTLQDLRNHDVEVFFEKENISSFDTKIEFVISIMSGMAEEEARIVSENVKWSVRTNFKKGNFYFCTQAFLGYDRDNDGNIIINEPQAKIVRRIFDLYATGTSVSDIISELNNINARTVYGNTSWYPNAVMNIIKNEKYSGDALLQKDYRPSFKSKLKKVNDNVLPKYYVENNHQPIVSKELFKKANKVRLARIDKYIKQDRNVYSKKSIYADFMYCPYCGQNYNHRVSHSGTEYSRSMMHCRSNKSKKLCESDKVSLKVFDQQLLKMINSIIKNKKELLSKYKTHLDSSNERKKLIKRKDLLLHKLNPYLLTLNTINSSDDFNAIVESRVKEKIKPVRSEIISIDNLLLTKYNTLDHYTRIKKLLHNYTSPITEISEFPFKELFSKVIVDSKDNIKFVVGSRDDYNNFNSKKKGLYSQSTDYLMRKCTKKSFHGLYFF
jgi:DNA invertase Pin-like site-specific DNA recombinase